MLKPDMLVYLQRNYTFPDLFRQTPQGSGKWKDLQFTFEEPSECEAVVVLNHPLKNIRTRCPKGQKIILVQEPPYEGNNYYKLHFRFYDTIVSGFKSEKEFTSLNTQAALPWHVGKNHDELMSLPSNADGKIDKVSWITSNNNIFPQHKVRLDFIDFLKKQGYDFDLFGRGFTPIADKFDGIYPYKYTIAAENYIGEDYFTEKIIDAYLSWSMPIYYGSPNITKYFPAESLVQVDLKQPQEALAKIKEAVENKWWDKNLEAIAHARDLVLNKYQLFPMVHDLIMKKQAGHSVKTPIFLPASGLTQGEEWKKKVRKLFSKKA